MNKPVKERIKEFIAKDGIYLAIAPLVYLFAYAAVYYPTKYVWNIINGKYDTRTVGIMILIWVLVNLVLYQIIAAVIFYIWQYRNKKNFVIHASTEERKILMRRFGVTIEEELDKIEEKPSILASILLGSSAAPHIIRNFFIDGPHIPFITGEKYKTVDGIIKSKRLFDYAAMRGEIFNKRFFFLIFQRQYFPFVILFGLLGYLSITFWCLIPFTRAAVQHYRKINDFVANFSPYNALQMRNLQDVDINHIQELYDLIWNKKPYEDYIKNK